MLWGREGGQVRQSQRRREANHGPDRNKYFIPAKTSSDREDELFRLRPELPSAAGSIRAATSRAGHV